MHPLSIEIIHPVNRDQLTETRDILRASLGYSEDMAKAIGQQCLDDEIYVALQDDGSQLFAVRPSFED